MSFVCKIWIMTNSIPSLGNKPLQRSLSMLGIATVESALLYGPFTRFASALCFACSPLGRR